MPLDTPSQFQTGVAKGLEGLFSGIRGGMEGQKQQAYLDALNRLRYNPDKTTTVKYEGLPTEKKVTMDYSGLGGGAGTPKQYKPFDWATQLAKATQAGATAVGLPLKDVYTPADFENIDPRRLAEFNAAFRASMDPSIASYNATLPAGVERLPTELEDYLQERNAGQTDPWFSKPKTIFRAGVNPTWASVAAGKGKPKAKTKSGLGDAVKQALEGR